MLVNRNGRNVGKGLESLAELFFGPGKGLDALQEGHWPEESPSAEKDTVARLRGEIEAARKRRQAVEALVLERERLQDEVAYAEKRATEATKPLEDRIKALRLLMHQAQSLRGFGLDQQALESASEELPVLEEELEQTRATWKAKIEEPQQRIKEIQEMPTVQAYLAERREEAMDKARDPTPGESDESESAATELVGNAAEDSMAFQPPTSTTASDPEVKQAEPLKPELRKAFTAWLHRQVKPKVQPGDLVLTLGLGKAVHLRLGQGGEGKDQTTGSVVSSVGIDLAAGQRYLVRCVSNGPKPTYRLEPMDGGRHLVGRLWVWGGDPEKGPQGPSAESDSEHACAEVAERRSKYTDGPVVVCTLSPSQGAFEDTKLGRYWTAALAEALRHAGVAVSGDHPLLPPDGATWVWGVYSDGEETAVELFSTRCGQPVKLSSNVRRRNPDTQLAARTRHLQRQFRSSLKVLLPR